MEARLKAVRRCWGGVIALLGAAVLAGFAAAQAPPSNGFSGTFTQRNHIARTGQSLREFALTPATVNPAQFGQLFSCAVDGYVYAQPLYVSNVAVPGQGTHNAVFVATEHGSVYAFDADDATCVQLWMTSFIDSTNGITTVPSADVLTDNIVPEVGITGTPVIDSLTGTLYVVAATKESTTYVQRLHALDITTGLETMGGPVVIQASVPGTGQESDGVNVAFNPLRSLQRAALLLSQGVVYIAARWSERSEEHTSELQSRLHLVCRLLLEKKK